jgi:hypothetical protein
METSMISPLLAPISLLLASFLFSLYCCGFFRRYLQWVQTPSPVYTFYIDVSQGLAGPLPSTTCTPTGTNVVVCQNTSISLKAIILFRCTISISMPIYVCANSCHHIFFFWVPFNQKPCMFYDLRFSPIREGISDRLRNTLLPPRLAPPLVFFLYLHRHQAPGTLWWVLGTPNTWSSIIRMRAASLCNIFCNSLFSPLNPPFYSLT